MKRRVRTIPGGKDSIGALLGGDEEQEFKPTRRYVTCLVQETRDKLNDCFSLQGPSETWGSR